MFVASRHISCLDDQYRIVATNLNILQMITISLITKVHPAIIKIAST